MTRLKFYASILDRYREPEELGKTTLWAILLICLCFICWIGTARAEIPYIDIPTIIQIESSGNPRAVSKDNCVGLMQISEVVLLEYNRHFYGDENDEFYYPIHKKMLFDPDLNEQIGTWYLTERIPQMLRYYHKPVTIENMLWAYNAGIGNLVRGVKPKETRNYIAKYKRLTEGH